MKKPDNWSKEQVGEDRAKQEGTEQGRTEYLGLNLIGCLLKKKPEEDTRDELSNGKTIEKSLTRRATNRKGKAMPECEVTTKGRETQGSLF